MEKWSVADGKLLRMESERASASQGGRRAETSGRGQEEAASVEVGTVTRSSLYEMWVPLWLRKSKQQPCLHPRRCRRWDFEGRGDATCFVGLVLDVRPVRKEHVAAKAPVCRKGVQLHDKNGHLIGFHSRVGFFAAKDGPWGPQGVPSIGPLLHSILGRRWGSCLERGFLPG